MGYYTNYDLVAVGYSKRMSKAEAVMLIEDVKRIAPLDYCDYYEDETLGFVVEAVGEAKWYDNMDDMYELSKDYPDIRFTLSGNGESGDDIWRHYWLNGNVQSDGIIIVQNEFSLKKLKKYERRD